MNLHPIPAFSDNYIWMIDDGHRAWVVDPGDPAPVREYLSKRGLTLAGILVTHHHFDHVGGLADLVAATGCEVVGPDNPSIEPIKRVVSEGDSLTILGSSFSVLEVPGHTLDHIAYYCADASLLFCGDTLFAAGCGRLFEGNPAMMWDSLSKLAALPATTRVCCAHEYTLANLAFARAADPDNAELRHRENECKAIRANNQPTLPSSIGVELATNPFMRADNASLAASLQGAGRVADASPVSVFAALRSWKDAF